MIALSLLLCIIGVGLLVLTIVWPLDPAADDVMQHPHGDQPRLPQ